MLNTKERKSQHTFIFRVSWLLLAGWLRLLDSPSPVPVLIIILPTISYLSSGTINDTPRTEEGSKKKKKTKKAAMQQQHERQAQRLIELNSIRDRSFVTIFNQRTTLWEDFTCGRRINAILELRPPVVSLSAAQNSYEKT